MKTAFSVRDLHFTYPTSKEEVLHGISFDIKEGEIFGLLGPSGAGKSTVQKILTKILSGYSGEIDYFDKDFKKIDKSFYEEIGVGFELPVSFGKLTAVENLKFFSMLYKSKADYMELLKKVGLFEDKDKKVSEYSKGMKMRLNFVRAMLNNPKFLFLDEVTNGLDPKNSKIIKDMILDFKKEGGTVLLTTHLMSDVEQLCDRVAFIVDGQIAEIEETRKLKLKYGKREVSVEYNYKGATRIHKFDLDTLCTNENFIKVIKNCGVETIHSGETSLEEIFIKLTGKSV